MHGFCCRSFGVKQPTRRQIELQTSLSSDVSAAQRDIRSPDRSMVGCQKGTPKDFLENDGFFTLSPIIMAVENDGI